jgi:hypothetical protein
VVDCCTIRLLCLHRSIVEAAGGGKARQPGRTLLGAELRDYEAYFTVDKLRQAVGDRTLGITIRDG